MDEMLIQFHESIPASISPEVAHVVVLRAAQEEARERLGQFLAAAWRVKAETLKFAHDPHGKIVVIKGTPQRGDFSLSHSGGWVAMALSPWGRIGIDVELFPTEITVLPDGLTRREQERIESFAELERLRALATIWSAKEALAKAMGLGVALDFAAAEIDLPSLDRPIPRVVAGSAEIAAGWRMECRALPDAVVTIALAR